MYKRQALENGVEFIACQMSMDVMGVKQEELLDEVTVGGVATVSYTHLALFRLAFASATDLQILNLAGKSNS